MPLTLNKKMIPINVCSAPTLQAKLGHHNDYAKDRVGKQMLALET